MTMKKHLITVCMGMLGLMLPACSSNSDPDNPNPIPPLEDINLSPDETAINDGINTFAFELLNTTDAKCAEIYESQYDGNVSVSPLSATLALAMLANAGDDALTDATTKLLHCSGLAELNTVSNKLMRHLTTSGKLELANAVWYNPQRIAINSSFVKSMADTFYADVDRADFGTDKATDLINAWCAARTHGKISKILNDTSQDDVFYLINALYFNDEWAYKFSKSDTGPGTFADRTIEAMMHNDYSGNFFANDRYSCVEMPFKNGTSMHILLPADTDTDAAQTLARSLTYTQWKDDLASAKKYRIILSLPRFDINRAGRLDKALFAMGLPQGGSSLSKMGTSLTDRQYQLIVIQKTATTVNERGAEVAAATVVGGVTAAAPEEESGLVTFTVDRPFVYLITNQKTGTVLMAGRINTIM